MEIVSEGLAPRRIGAIEKLGMRLSACGKPAGRVTSLLRNFIDSDFVPQFESYPGIGLSSNLDGDFVRVSLEVPTFSTLEQQTLKEARRLNDLGKVFVLKVSVPLLPEMVRFNLTFSPIGEAAKTSFEGMCQIAASEQGAIFHGIYPDPNA